jgi:hypothetical protein
VVAPRFCFLGSVTAIVPIVTELGVDVKQVPQRAPCRTVKINAIERRLPARGLAKQGCYRRGRPASAPAYGSVVACEVMVPVQN